MRIPTHRCKRCGNLWTLHAGGWSMFSPQVGTCCDNEPMGEQIEPLPLTAGGIDMLHRGVADLLKFFSYEHLPPHLGKISAPFAELAWIVANGPQNAETTAAIRKLLEAKDCAVRAAIPTSI